MSPPDRTVGIIEAAARDFNDDLTIILSCTLALVRTLEPGHPAREAALDVQSAAQRCAWRASGLLNYAARRGARAGAWTMERLIEEGRYA